MLQFKTFDPLSCIKVFLDVVTLKFDNLMTSLTKTFKLVKKINKTRLNKNLVNGINGKVM